MNQRHWLIMIPMGITVAMVNLDISAVNLALAHIANDLHVSLSAIQWVVNGYSMAAAMFMVIGSRLADTWGRHTAFTVCLSLFLAGSIAAGLANGEPGIVIGRIVQGIGMASFPVAMVIVHTAFPEKHRSLAMGITSAIAGLSQVVGPTLGGAILHYLGWRWIFFINVPLGITAVILARLWVPEMKPEARPKLDYIGQTLLAAGLFAMLCALNEVQKWGWDSPAFLALLFGGAALLFVFVAVERRTRNPLIELDLFADSAFVAANLIRVIFQIVSFGLFFLLGLYFQNVLCFTAIKAGLLLLWLTATMAVLAPVVGQCMDKIGARIPLLVGMALTAAGCLLLSRSLTQASLVEMAVSLGVLGVGFSAALTGTVSAALSSAPKTRAGLAAGVLYMNALVGASLGTAATGLVLRAEAHASVGRFLASQPVELTASQRQCVERVAVGAHSPELLSTELPAGAAPKVMPAAREGFVAGFRKNLQIYAWLSCIGLALTWFLRPPQRREGDRDTG
ncbi:MAG: DHA2 family efflux MFS transporter permease subunit [Verrucomicrobiia bacterium]